MAEWIRIFSNRVWLGAAVLLLLCNLGLYAREQSSQAGGSVHAYREYTNQWMQTLSEVSPEDGLALLEQENQTLQGWNAARLLAQMEAGQGQVDDELLSRYRTQYDNFDAMFQAVRDGTAPAQDIAAQKAVTRWMDRLTYQMNYDEFLSSISSQADVIRRNPLFSDPHTFVYRNADKTETDYLSTRDAALKLQPGGCGDVDHEEPNLGDIQSVLDGGVHYTDFGVQAIGAGNTGAKLHQRTLRCDRMADRGYRHVRCDSRIPDARRDAASWNTALSPAVVFRRSGAVHSFFPALGRTGYGRRRLALVFPVQRSRAVCCRASAMAGTIQAALTSIRLDRVRRCSAA